MHLTIIFFLGFLSIISATPLSQEPNTGVVTNDDNFQIQGLEDLTTPAIDTTGEFKLSSATDSTPGSDTTGDTPSPEVRLSSAAGLVPEQTNTDDVLANQRAITNPVLVAEKGVDCCPAFALLEQQRHMLDQYSQALDRRDAIMKKLDKQLDIVSKALNARAAALDKLAAALSHQSAALSRQSAAGQKWYSALQEANAAAERSQVALSNWQRVLEQKAAAGTSD